MDIQQISAAQTWPLRRALLNPDRQLEDQAYPGDTDPTTVHVGLFIGVSLVGVASFLPQSVPNYEGGYRLRGLGVLPAVNRPGLAEKLVLTGIEEAKKRGAAYIWCVARMTAVPFYQALGFQTLGEVLNLPEIGLRRRMVLPITENPAETPEQSSSSEP